MPAQRALWLRAVAEIRDSTRPTPGREAERDALVIEAKRKAGQL